jgi:hypothetical protein
LDFVADPLIRDEAANEWGTEFQPRDGLPGDGLDETELDDESEAEREDDGPGVEREKWLFSWSFGGHGVLPYEEAIGADLREVSRGSG